MTQKAVEITLEERYKIARASLVCPDCGSDLKVLPMSEIVPNISYPENAVGLRCTGEDTRNGKCKYWVFGGETQ